VFKQGHRKTFGQPRRAVLRPAPPGAPYRGAQCPEAARPEAPRPEAPRPSGMGVAPTVRRSCDAVPPVLVYTVPKLSRDLRAKVNLK
jgi:hypothetical protein